MMSELDEVVIPLPPEVEGNDPPGGDRSRRVLAEVLAPWQPTSNNHA
jgi:hypothetical protein